MKGNRSLQQIVKEKRDMNNNELKNTIKALQSQIKFLREENKNLKISHDREITALKGQIYILEDKIFELMKDNLE
jgi:predicted  nucleic acid-binding Zn-ribbon protein